MNPDPSNAAVPDPREINRLLSVLRDSEQGSDRYASTLSALAILLANDKTGLMEVVRQCSRAPTWDGSVPSKHARDKALKYGFLVKCCYNEEQGYQVTTYLGWAVIREIDRQKGLKAS